MASRRLCLSPAAHKRRALVVAIALACVPAMALAVGEGDADLGAGPLLAGADAERGYSLSDLDAPIIGGGTQLAPGERELYLDIYFGERPVGQIARFRERDGKLYGRPEELREVGVVVPAEVVVPADGWVPLDGIAGLNYRYVADQQRLVLAVQPGLRPRQQLGYQVPPPARVERSTGLLLNYDAYGRAVAGENTVSLATQFRWFGRAGTLELSGVGSAGSTDDGFRRLDTRWSYSDPKHMWTWTAGDVVNAGLAWSRPVRVGGLQWRRNFGVRPDLITFPMPRFSGEATVPSSVELLVNNVRQFGSEVEDGPFVLDAFPHITGAGEATLVVRDALGRSTQTSVPIYVDYQRLARGLTDFSLEAGRLRLGYGSAQDRYGDDWVASGSIRHGVLDALTLEAHGESGPRLQTLGVGAVWSPGNRWGLLTASWTRRSGDGHGDQWTLGYQWITPRGGLDLQTQRRDADYRDLGDLGSFGSLTDPQLANQVMREQDRASFWVPVPRGSLALTWVRWRQADDTRDRIATASWNQILGKDWSFTASAFHSQSSGRGVGVSLTVPLDRRRDVSAFVDHSEGRNQATLAMHQYPDYDGGWGWSVQAGAGQRDFAQASVQRRGRLGEFEIGVDHNAGRTGSFFQGNGSVLWMAERVVASRRVGDSFALVSTGGVADVPVLYENRLYARTDKKGFVLLPDLRGWQANRVAIDPDALGPNFRLPPLEQFVTPADRSGVLARFPIQALRPAWVVLLDPQGKPVPAGLRATLSGTEEPVLVGLDGEAYVENWVPGATLELPVADGRCRYRLPALPANAGDDERVGPLTCEVMPP